MRAELLMQLQAKYGSADWSKWQPFRWQFWDYVRYNPAGTTQLSFFVNPTGSVDPVSGLQKTLEQTNVPTSRGLGEVFFFMRQIRTHISILPLGRQVATIRNDADVLYTTITDLISKWNQLSRLGILQMTLGQKQYLQIEQPFVTAPPGFGLEIQQHSSHHAANWTKFSAWPQQSNCEQDVWNFSPPQLIEPRQIIFMTIDFPELSPVFTGLVDGVDPAIDCGVIMDGYLLRPTQ